MPNHTILIVDDDQEILALYQKIFSPSKEAEFAIMGSSVPAPATSLKCHIFSDPLALVSEYAGMVREGRRCPLCLIDMRMPILNGLTTALKIREIDPGIDIVICTAFSDVSAEEIREKIHGGVFFIRKPFVVEEFSLLIDSLVGVWNARMELTQAKAEMAGQCERLEQILEATRVGTWDWEIPTEKLSINRRWAEIVGFDLHELEPVAIEAWRRLCHPEDLQRSGQLLKQVFSGELQYYDCECRMRHKDGSWVWVHDRGKVTEWLPNGKPLRMSGTHSDITVRKQAENELQERNAEMERFTYAVSHDLKSPLVTIKTFLSYLEQDMQEEKAQAVSSDLGHIHRAAEKMESLLGELLELARAGRTISRPEETTLQEIVEEALAQVAGQISERGVKVTVTQEPVWLYGDRPRLVAVFQNLVENAVKFLGAQAAPRLEIGVTRAGEGLELFVRDNGGGIDPRHQSKVFGLFEKGDSNAPGFGIGLAMVRRIVEVHGGKILVESDGLGRGATFRFTLEKTRIDP